MSSEWKERSYTYLGEPGIDIPSQLLLSTKLAIPRIMCKYLSRSWNILKLSHPCRDNKISRELDTENIIDDFLVQFLTTCMCWAVTVNIYNSHDYIQRLVGHILYPSHDWAMDWRRPYSLSLTFPSTVFVRNHSQVAGLRVFLLSPVHHIPPKEYAVAMQASHVLLSTSYAFIAVSLSVIYLNTIIIILRFNLTHVMTNILIC